ncbi:MAG: squalene/phytoene synthase family protein [Halanaerobiaceae bacterium]
MSNQAIDFCKKILPRVSRSFALTIPMLDKEIYLPVLITYLQDRLLDNFEDEISDEDISIAERKKMMDRVVDLFNPEIEGYQEIASEISQYASLMPEKSLKDLTANCIFLREAYNTMDDNIKRISFSWLVEMNKGMQIYLEKNVRTFNDLDDYCYYVAGTVGGFLTDLIIYISGIEKIKIDGDNREILRKHFNASGLFLQKLNLIRDIKKDIENREKHYWPLESLSVSIPVIFKKENQNLAMQTLDKMLDDLKAHIPSLISYYNAIPDKFNGYKKFYAVNNALGLATIEELDKNPQVFYGYKPVKVSKLAFLAIIRNPEKIFLKKAEKISPVVMSVTEKD